MTHSRVVLITGCSSGIGRATAERLARAGWTVYATARRLGSIAELEAAGCHLLELDVTDEAAMQAAVEAVERAAGAVGVLVNNAGYSLSCAIESVPLDEVRRQFETNVFGLVRLSQLVLPGMRRQGFGRIVNVSSMGGRLTFPGGGYYHATKHAVEALSDALPRHRLGTPLHRPAPPNSPIASGTRCSRERSLSRSRRAPEIARPAGARAARPAGRRRSSSRPRPPRRARRPAPGSRSRRRAPPIPRSPRTRRCSRP